MGFKRGVAPFVLTHLSKEVKEAKTEGIDVL